MNDRPEDATRTSLGPDLPTSTASSSSALSSFPVSSPGQGRFLPGTIIAGRYRVIGQLGAGGMGEVYRADDVRLGQTVALKFLPPAFASDARRLEAFRAEVRLAREVTHPNVCRVHDLGEVEGEIFLSMEYVDGEDLGSLLRRIGRVPQDKALELARQICAGLAAAHERGVLHRDLKPANVMIDGRGRARIMDFGLAAVTGTVRREDIRSGTPHYMAPEAFEGREVTARSDVYSLGLVLYELFTGRRAIEAKTLAELKERHATGSAFSLPSALVADLDPAVESVILRCVEPEPAARPASVVAVAAALPGGDPLAAALAAGETPSPELVAAAGGEGALAPRVAWSWLAVVLASVLLLAFTAPTTTLLGRAPFEKPPDVLEERAREILAGTGHELKLRDKARGLQLDRAYLDWIARERGPRAFATVVPRPFEFWYRQADAPLRPLGAIFTVSPSDPPLNQPGSAMVVLDSAARLLMLAVPPPEVESAEAPAGAATATPPVAGAAPAAPALPGAASAPPAVPAEPDWTPLLRAAGLDPARAQEARPSWTPPTYADARRAWSVPSPDGTGTVLQVEAASYRGRPVSFLVRGPWQRSLRAYEAPSAGQQAASLVSVILLVGSIVTAALFARRNVKSGRGDRRGAVRLGFATLLLASLNFQLASQFPRRIDLAWDSLSGAISVSLFVAGLLWLLYLALEPIVRRGRPQSLVSWNRVLAGRWRDPLVGRDLLVGSAYGAAMVALIRLEFLLPAWLGLPVPRPQVEWLEPLGSANGALTQLIGNLLAALLLGMLMQFFMSFAMVRREGQWLGFPVFLVISFVVFYVGSLELTLPLRLAFTAALSLVWTHLFARRGLVAGIAAAFVLQWRMPIVLDPSAFYAWTSFVMTLALLAIPVWGFRVALGDRPALGGPGAAGGGV